MSSPGQAERRSRKMMNESLLKPFEYHGMQLLRTVDEVLECYHLDIGGFEDILCHLDVPRTLRQLENYKHEKAKMKIYQTRGIHQLDCTIPTVPYCKDGKLWRFARIFDPRFFSRQDIIRNKELMLVAIYLLPDHRQGAKNCFKIKDFIASNPGLVKHVTRYRNSCLTRHRIPPSAN